MSAGYFCPTARSGLDCSERSERRPVTIPALAIRTTVPTVAARGRVRQRAGDGREPVRSSVAGEGAMCDVAGVQGGVGLDGAGHAAVDGGKLVINRHHDASFNSGQYRDARLQGCKGL